MGKGERERGLDIMVKTVLKNHLKLLCAAAVFLFSYVPTFIWMWDRWFARDSYYSHGVLVPFVTAFLIWQKRGELTSTEKSESGWGMPLIVAGMLLHIFASLLRVYFVSGFSMLIVLAGLILYFYGLAVFQKILFPVLFLVFMVPMPLIIITNVSFQMKIFAAKIAAGILNNIGIPALRQGSLIIMRNAQVVVDDVCSGLRSLISLMALGSIFAYWMKSSAVKKYVLFAATIPIAVLTNVARIIFLSSIAEIWGPQSAIGFIHDASGFLVFALAFILLYVMVRILE
ncbi:MAG: exosortase/archaeosortase family protein [Candidatus Omnitrophica bacterium]|nr:exosortase/archaeosortase family protein [Candidatus Omnitrophota bacterium]